MDLGRLLQRVAQVLDELLEQRDLVLERGEALEDDVQPRLSLEDAFETSARGWSASLPLS